MKFRIHWAILAAVAIAGSAAVSRAQSTTGQVYEITISASMLMQSGSISKQALTTQALLNEARGRSPDAVVPANEKLVLEFVFSNSGNPQAALAVFDTTGHTNLTELGSMDVKGIIDPVKHTGIAAVAGNVQSGFITDGWLAFAGKITVQGSDASTVITSFSASAVQGAMDGNDGSDFELIIQKGKVAIVGSLGLIVF